MSSVKTAAKSVVWFVVTTAFALVLSDWLGARRAAFIVGSFGLLSLPLLYANELKLSEHSLRILNKGAKHPMAALLIFTIAGGVLGAALFGASWLWTAHDYKTNPLPLPAEKLPKTSKLVTVSPGRINVSSKEWTRVDIVTITNHEESPRYGLTFATQPNTADIEYEIEGPTFPRVMYTDNSTDIPIPQIGPKASYVFQLKSRLKGGAKSSQGEITFSVTDGTDEPVVPGVMFKGQPTK